MTDMPSDTPHDKQKQPTEMHEDINTETPTPHGKQKEPMEMHEEINTEISSTSSSEQRASSSQQPPKLPCVDLLGDKAKYQSICVPFYEAAVKGNWEAAAKIISENSDSKVLECSITENNETALHIAVSARSTKQTEDFVRKLVFNMEDDDLKLPNKNNNTALYLAAAGGNVKIAKFLVERNKSLLDISGSQGMLPLYVASLYRRRDMVNYLYEKSNKMNDDQFWRQQNRVWVLLRCVEADFFDIAVEMVTDRPELSKSWEVLGALARKNTDAFKEIKPHIIWRVISKIIRVKVGPVEKETHALQLIKLIWNYIMENLDKTEINDIIRGQADKEPQDKEATKSHVKKKTYSSGVLFIAAEDKEPQDKEATKSHVKKKTYSSRVLFIAAEVGNTRFIVELIRQYPDLIWKVNDRNQSIFHVAVLYRHEGIYNLLEEIGSMKDFITPIKDEDGNTMLHLAAKCAKKKRLEEISGVAQQMQRELLWYKEVEGLLPLSYQEKKNNDGLLPHELFTKEHKDLLSASEKWMKDTASHCMVVAALIATVVFAAAFTVPGGYTDKKGIPNLQSNKAFKIFVISDAISLTFSTISIFMFLSILTSRYAEQDFLESLPKKLMRGLAALFLSITTMMVAFSVSFFALYDEKLIWVPIVITALASFPVLLYVRVQYGLLANVYHSTYGSKNLFKPKKPMLY